MIEALPAYVSPFFIATTFLTVGFLFYAVKTAGTESWPARLILFFVPFWMLFQAAVSLGGFFQDTSALPPRIFALAALPAVLFLSFIAFAGGQYIDRLSLRTLTLLSIIRVPVEFALLLLYRNGLVPEAMTFEGTNFDILSGISAPVMAWLAFRGGRIHRPLLIIWNITALLLLINIVTTAVLAFPSPFQKIAFDQPNKAIMFFPFVWLPSVVVPIVFFSHLVSLRRLLTNKLGGSPI
jgi:hypothetical protein